MLCKCKVSLSENKNVFSEKDLLFAIPDEVSPANGTGSFARRILVLHAVGAPAAVDFLAKVLGAANLDMARDTLRFALSPGEAFDLRGLANAKLPTHILVFGLHPAQLGLTIDAPLYQPCEFYGATHLFADDLASLEPDRVKKSSLWLALRQIFL
jgi:hypothetical protein